MLNLDIQYWTSRGFCVADVDYRGSTGYGRRYREALQGRWGIVDLDDVVACARYLADAGRVDPARMAIRGGSAGGYTTLAALTHAARRLHRRGQPLRRRRPRRAGGGDAQVRVAVPRRAGRARGRRVPTVYAERSPINHVDALDTPLAVFQGDEDAGRAARRRPR